MGWKIWLVAKQHRLELALAAFLSVVAGLAAVYVTLRFAGVAVPGPCIGAWNRGGPGTEDCLPYLEAFGRIYFEEGGKVLAAMAIVPVVAGLLGGVPIVGRELEAGTAQFAWAIAPSRLGWLRRQLLVVGFLLALTVGFSAIASEMLELTRRISMPAPPFDNVGLHGAIAFVRMLTALMVGLFIGTLIGRTLPAFIIGALLMMGLLLVAGSARGAWAASQPSVVVERSGGSDFDGQVVGLGWIDPAGRLISYAEGLAKAPPSTEDDRDTWLMEHGYEQVQLGITSATASVWVPIEAAAWVGAGLVLMVCSGWLVSRKRPV
jgi:hypothetical protein